MIRGNVTVNHEPVVCLRVRGPSGVEVDVDVIVDTGYNGSLTLPTPIVRALCLPWQSGGRAVLADGSAQPIDYYEVQVMWGSSWRLVTVMSVGSESLLGMRMLTGQRLTIDGGPGGAVEIASRP